MTVRACPCHPHPYKGQNSHQKFNTNLISGQLHCRVYQFEEKEHFQKPPFTSSLSMGISQPSLTVPWTRIRHLCSRNLSESRNSYFTPSSDTIRDWVAVSKPTGCSSQQTKENDWILLVWKGLLEATWLGREVATGSQPWRERTETIIITTRPG